MTIKIYFRQHVLLAAEVLKLQLVKLGHEVELVDWCNPEDSTLCIVYCAFIPDPLPPNYIVYQTEVPGSHWFNSQYLNALVNAKAIWDYNISNTTVYQQHVEKTSIVTPGIHKGIFSSQKDGIVFYGAINGRRSELIGQLRTDYEIKVVENVYNVEMWRILTESLIVLNFHFYPQAPLEVFRINEALSFGCHVISETGAGMERYREQVYFAENPAQIRGAIEKCLKRDFDYDLSGLDNFEEVKKAMAKI